ncbi:MAG: GNAT family N-acetyltransferase [Eubacteriales bacterium]|nr:GNAT family N-acetyltransferase [Eubacteriales bacterium]
MERKILCSTEADSKRVHKMLMEYNLRYMHDFEDYNFHIEENGEIIAGIVAWCVSDTLEVEYLRVADSHRREGLGTQLLNHVEKLAREKGFKRIQLNTLSFQAPEFYLKHGYTKQFESPFFDNYTQIYFIKDLTEEE